LKLCRSQGIPVSPTRSSPAKGRYPDEHEDAF